MEAGRRARSIAAVAAAIAAVGLSVTPPVRAADFAPAVDFYGSEYPFDVELVDVDGDGWLDALTADDGIQQPRVTVLRGAGDGGLAGATAYRVTSGAPRAVHGSDVDGDGHVDMIVADPGADRLLVLPGRGDGTFDTPTALPVGDAPLDALAGDIEGDGVLDLVSLDHDADTVTLLRGLGGGQFASGRAFATGFRYPARGALGDIDRDGHVDVVVTLFSDGVAVLWGEAGGQLSEPAIVRMAGMHGSGVRNVALGDLNADGNLDVVTAGGTSVWVIAGGASRALGEPRAFPAYPEAGADGLAGSLALADVDGDADLDVAVVNQGTTTYRGNLAVLHGDGAGNLGPAEAYDIPAKYPDEYSDEVGAGPIDVVSGDLNGDRRPDLAVAHRLPWRDTGGVAVLLNAGTWQPDGHGGPPSDSQNDVTVPPEGPPSDPQDDVTVPPEGPPSPGASVTDTNRAGRVSPARRSVRLRIGRSQVRGCRAKVLVRHRRAAVGRTVVAVRRRGSRRWHRVAVSRRPALRVRFRRRCGTYRLRARFDGVLDGRRVRAVDHRRLRLRRL